MNNSHMRRSLALDLLAAGFFVVLGLIFLFGPAGSPIGFWIGMFFAVIAMIVAFADRKQEKGVIFDILIALIIIVAGVLVSLYFFQQTSPKVASCESVGGVCVEDCADLETLHVFFGTPCKEKETVCCVPMGVG